MRSTIDLLGSRPLGDRCAMLLSRLCALLMLGDGLVARLLRFSVEPMVEPCRRGFAVWSRLVEALRGKPKPPVCFSSLLRLCLCPGRCSLCPPIEALCDRPLLLDSACEGWLLLWLGASCQTVSPGLLQGRIDFNIQALSHLLGYLDTPTASPHYLAQELVSAAVSS